MKAMLTPHKPGDSGILCLPLKSNVPNGHKNWKLVANLPGKPWEQSQTLPPPVPAARCRGKGGVLIDKQTEQKKQWLRSYQAMERQSQRLLEELEQWKSRAAKVTRAFSGAPGGRSSDPLPECVGKIMELEEALNRQIDQMVDQRKIIEKAIGAVPQTLQREVLSLRYIKIGRASCRERVSSPV